jgi:hypothetical protein
MVLAWLISFLRDKITGKWDWKYNEEAVAALIID